MAAEDYNVADRPNAGLTAGDKIGEVTIDPANNPDAVAAAAADTAGVRYAAFVDYAEALDALAAREDIEGLDSRRVREAATTFAAADYMRGEASDTAPTPGSVNGVAPDPTA
jgi:hypothetical protein